ncbi:unnamed protein product [Lactuca virosa]|uniref:Secreted protein n=1 Tax=Lactuca virosa TaxID=75947 RepID=A0AAU9N954_9ASTR|nr:unnamed protein product [Lactuca virosa]
MLVSLCACLGLQSGKKGRPSRSLCFLLRGNLTRERVRRIGTQKSYKGLAYQPYRNHKTLLLLLTNINC